MYHVEFSRDAERFLDKLDTTQRERILKRLNNIRDNPIPHLKKLSGASFWRLRIDDYRAILDVIIVRRMLFVVRIGHRKNVPQVVRRKDRPYIVVGGDTGPAKN
jgi:mRNA interferase RelE/StbE